jgi:DMSO/TMAO reductase YedYZ molybdopterin-dependent catalytic subunit
MDRRAFLKAAGVAGLVLTSGCRAEGSDLVPGVQAPVDRSPALPREVIPPAPSQIVITPTGELFTQAFAGIPTVDPSEWRLHIDGLVKRPLELSHAEILAHPKVESVRTLACIGNPVGGSLIGTPRWGGVLADDLWTQVRIRPEATHAKFTAMDGYRTSVDLAWILQPGVLLAHEMNGEPLPAEHGFPLRILMPGLYGQKMPKWITCIEFIEGPFLGYWESNGWSDTADVRTHSAIWRPRRGELIRSGNVPVYGLAFAGLRRITGVEVRIDDGDWQPTARVQDNSPLAWTQWSSSWLAAPGEHRIAVRARDEAGFMQGTDSGSLGVGAFPAGADAIHAVTVDVLP